MHDIDRAMFEMAQEGQAEHGETYELALAGELLAVRDEAELDRFLGSLVSGAIAGGKAFLNSDAGRAVGGLLKSAAKAALPTVGGAIGNWIAPGAGGQIGTKAASWLAGKLELEGLSQEDREMEAARAFVRFANDAVRQSVAAPPTAPPAQVAVQAAMSAARRQLPAIVPVLQRLTPPAPGRPGPRGHSGRWVRRGSTIVLFNV